jgi:hypothetical protein
MAGMAEPVDYYDVQGMIRDARSETRGDIDRAVRDAVRDARAEMHSELQIVRSQINDLSQEIAALGRVLQSRTEHLV